MSDPLDYMKGDAKLEARFRASNPPRRHRPSMGVVEGEARATPARLDAVLRVAKRADAPEIHPLFRAMLLDAGLTIPEREFKFHPNRKWRFDYSWVEQKVALEVEGGVWTGGRHTRGSGFMGDMSKYNEATCAGWRVLRCTPDTLATEATIGMIWACMGSAGEGGAK